MPRAFAALAQALAGTVDEVVLSVMHPYRKTRRNLDRAAQRHRFRLARSAGPRRSAVCWRGSPRIAAEHGIAPTLCSQPDLLVPGLGEARCIDAERLVRCRRSGRSRRATSGNRPGCRCALSRDIGAYDTCPHGCVYCYAVSDRDAALRNFRAHDPAADCLFPASSGQATSAGAPRDRRSGG